MDGDRLYLLSDSMNKTEVSYFVRRIENKNYKTDLINNVTTTQLYYTEIRSCTCLKVWSFNTSRVRKKDSHYNSKTSDSSETLLERF